MTPAAEDLLGLLGLSAAHERVVRALSEFGFVSGPMLPARPRDEQTWFDWLTSGSRGIEFGFQDQADFLAQAPQLRGREQLLLTQLCFYCAHPGVDPYVGPLPFGILRDDGRDEVRRKLATTGIAPRSYIRDVWDLPSFRLIVSYVRGGDAVASILCLLPIHPWPADPDEPGAPPDIDRLIELLGQTAESPRFRQAFDPLHIESFGFDPKQRGHLRLRHAFGFDLSLSEPFGQDVKQPLDSVLPVVTSIKFYRDREQDAYGWKGKLPLGIDFGDSQAALFEKAGGVPAVARDSDLQGFAVWHFDAFSLHVLYSNVHNYILRITLLQPGLWDAADTED